MAHPEVARQKAGWKKIEKTCELARQIYLGYAWIDTCCIDKTSSAELSEAINSMFLWYRNSIICFVHLCDYAELSQPTDTAVGLPSSGSDDLAGCKWFKRGWTLQELIASPRITFLDRNWEFRGTKETLRTRLASITGIDMEVLENAEAISTVSVGRRFSWAAHRRTKRVEDMAYCLLGIFRVSMPMLYGEGSRAFQRLQEEIARSTNDLTLFAWQQNRFSARPASSYRGIFARSPGEFRNCDKLIALQERLQAPTEFAITNRGVRFDTYFAVVDPSGQEGVSPDLVLGLDCLERSERTENVARWIGIRLRQVGAIYVRINPCDLDYSPSRASRLHATAVRKVVYTATALTDADTRIMETDITVGIYYRGSLKRFISQYDRGRNSDYESISSPRFSKSQLYFADSFASRGLGSCMHLHLFSVQIGVPSQCFRMALVCGLQVWKSHGSGANERPWAVLCSEQQFSGSRIQKLDVFNPMSDEGGLSREEKLEVFRDYLFEKYLDESGRLSQAAMPDRISIGEVHGLAAGPELPSISVHVNKGDSIYRVEDWGSGYSYAISLAYHRKSE